MSSESRQHGDLATQLVTESKRSTATDTLYKYNDHLVRTLIREQRQLEALVSSALDALPEDGDAAALAPSFVVHQAALLRNKRCLLAYHQHRMNMLKSLYWSKGAALPPLLTNPRIRANLAPHEVDFLR